MGQQVTYKLKDLKSRFDSDALFVDESRFCFNVRVILDSGQSVCMGSYDPKGNGDVWFDARRNEAQKGALLDKNIPYVVG